MLWYKIEHHTSNQPITQRHLKMNTILICAIVSMIIYVSGGILYIRIPFTKLLKITIVDKPLDIEWPSTQMFASYANATNDTVKIRKYESTYFTPYNLAMLFE